MFVACRLCGLGSGESKAWSCSSKNQPLRLFSCLPVQSPCHPNPLSYSCCSEGVSVTTRAAESGFSVIFACHHKEEGVKCLQENDVNFSKRFFLSRRDEVSQAFTMPFR